MKYKTLGVIATALILTGTGQLVYLPESAPAHAAENAGVATHLKELKTNPSQWTRAEAARQLGILRSKSALSQLHSSLIKDISKQVRINSANAIARINEKSSVPKLMEAIKLNSGKTDVQLAIIRAVGDMRNHSLETVPTLVRFLRSPNQFVREATVEALWKIRPKDPRVIHVLNTLMEEEDSLVVKLTLANVIADFKDPSTGPVLVKVLKRTDEHVDVRGLAQESLDKLVAMGVVPASMAHVASMGGKKGH